MRAIALFFGIVLCEAFMLGAQAQQRLLPARLPSVKNVQVEGSFWGPKLRVIKERSIPHSWQYVEGEIRALRRAAGEKVDGDPNGTWGEANLYKLMETVAYALAIFPDAELEKKMDAIIAQVAAAQRPDGYVHAFVTNAGKMPWDPAFLDGSHDGYVLGHMIEAAIEYHAATGKKNFLDVARKAADQAWRHFLGPDGKPGFCGHAELEMALVELHRVTGEQRYLDLARSMIDWRGRHVVPPCSETPRAYFQDGATLMNQRTLEGHAVRAVFFATGVADAAIETGNADYALAANRFWDSTTLRRMAITGGVGPRAEHEAFGEDYEIPLSGYYESCAACGLADFAQRMFLLQRRAESADVLERVLYNAILHGIALDGVTSYYCNPLADHDHQRDNCWVCCPPNLSRTVLQAGRYAYAQTDREIFVNLFVAGKSAFTLGENQVLVQLDTEYPWDGKVKLAVTPQNSATFAVSLRMPGWCVGATLKLNGTEVAPLPIDDRGYVRMDRTWNAGDVLDLDLPMPVERIEAHPNIADCRGKVALQRGPIVYAIEGIDNGGEAKLELPRDPQFRNEFRRDLLGGVTVIHGLSAQGKPFLAIPFYALANRDKSSQELWCVQQGLKASGAWWEGCLYRKVKPDRLTP